MEFCSPLTRLGALVPQRNFAEIDWAHHNPLDSSEANRSRPADNKAQKLEQPIMEQIPPDTQAYHDPLSLDTTIDPSKILFDPDRTATTPGRNFDVEKMAAPSPSSDGQRAPHAKDDDATSTTGTATGGSSDTASKRGWSDAAAAPAEGSATERRQRRRGSAPQPATEEARPRNRLAASKCRRKKKGEERGLEERQRRLNLQRAVLREAANALVHEVLALKHEVLRHASCGFPPLDAYVADATVRGSKSSSSSSSSSEVPS